MKEIKEKLMPADTVEEIEEYLSCQQNNIQKEIKILQRKHELIDRFRREMIKIKKIDWDLFVEILSLLRNNDQNYWLIKYFDKNVYDKIKNKHTKEKGEKYYAKMGELCDIALELQKKEISPSSEEALSLAEAWWQGIIDFTDGDLEMIQQMVNISSHDDPNNSSFMQKFKKVEGYISEVLTIYLQENNFNNIGELGDVSDD